ncbi:hypothetical protein C8F01DRAFT_1154877 [Mycena amicta]|nr:hypothetical protein C8F01DRAFT_1154877 [Mycena amicta]
MMLLPSAFIVVFACILAVSAAPFPVNELSGSKDAQIIKFSAQLDESSQNINLERTRRENGVIQYQAVIHAQGIAPCGGAQVTENGVIHAEGVGAVGARADSWDPAEIIGGNAARDNGVIHGNRDESARRDNGLLQYQAVGGAAAPGTPVGSGNAARDNGFIHGNRAESREDIGRDNGVIHANGAEPRENIGRDNGVIHSNGAESREGIGKVVVRASNFAF